MHKSILTNSHVKAKLRKTTVPSTGYKVTIDAMVLKTRDINT